MPKTVLRMPKTAFELSCGEQPTLEDRTLLCQKCGLCPIFLQKVGLLDLISALVTVLYGGAYILLVVVRSQKDENYDTYFNSFISAICLCERVG